MPRLPEAYAGIGVRPPQAPPSRDEIGPGGGRTLPVADRAFNGVEVGQFRRSRITGFCLLVEALLAERGWPVTAARCSTERGERRVVSIGRLGSDYEPAAGWGEPAGRGRGPGAPARKKGRPRKNA